MLAGHSLPPLLTPDHRCSNHSRPLSPPPLNPANLFIPSTAAAASSPATVITFIFCRDHLAHHHRHQRPHRGCPSSHLMTCCYQLVFAGTLFRSSSPTPTAPATVTYFKGNPQIIAGVRIIPRRNQLPSSPLLIFSVVKKPPPCQNSDSSHLARNPHFIIFPAAVFCLRSSSRETSFPSFSIYVYTYIYTYMCVCCAAATFPARTQRSTSSSAAHSCTAPGSISNSSCAPAALFPNSCDRLRLQRTLSGSHSPVATFSSLTSSTAAADAIIVGAPHRRIQLVYPCRH